MRLMFKDTFYFKTDIDRPLDEVWAFFQTNENLAAITGFPKIRILGEKDVYEGSDVHLQMDFLIMKMQWKGQITKVVPHAFFMDEGTELPFPFQTWRHVHAFKELDDGRTRMIDRVEFSALVPSPFVRLMLKGMFKDRERQLMKHFT